jgi:nitrile hydratase subunit alpha
MSHDHHDHDHDHDHDDDDAAHHHPAPLTDVERRVAAIESLLVERGLITSDAIDAIVEAYEHDLGPMNGAKVVARAWTDAAYRQRLLDDATAAIAELGFGGAEGEHMVALENTDAVHNVVVCTLCSCYPWPVLGLPPRWYKSAAYRSRVVREPRAVLSEFGTILDENVEVRVWDSSAEIRYLVLPQAPPDAASRSEDELLSLVTRDHMIGVVR